MGLFPEFWDLFGDHRERTLPMLGTFGVLRTSGYFGVLRGPAGLSGTKGTFQEASGLLGTWTLQEFFVPEVSGILLEFGACPFGDFRSWNRLLAYLIYDLARSSGLL